MIPQLTALIPQTKLLDCPIGISCTKHRNSRMGAVKLLFDATFSRWRNLAVRRD